MKEPLAQLHDRFARKHRIVGSGLVAIRDGALVHESHVGHADRATGRRADIHTIYHWASVTKTMTAIAVMQLRDCKMLRLEDPVVAYVPELRAMRNPFGRMEDITLRHLLTHAAGFRGPTWPRGEPPVEDWETLMQTRPGFRLLFKPGSRYSYSNLGINFLGRTIEQVTGQDYPGYMRKNLFAPLGMKSSYFNQTPERLKPHRANSYALRDGHITANGPEFATGITACNGGLNAPLSDMLRYMEFLCGGDGPLDRGTLKSMWKPVLSADESDGFVQHMGLSFFLLARGGKKLVGHVGSQRNFLSFLCVNPADRAAVAGVVNTSGPQTRAGLYALRRAAVAALL